MTGHPDRGNGHRMTLSRRTLPRAMGAALFAGDPRGHGHD